MRKRFFAVIPAVFALASTPALADFTNPTAKQFVAQAYRIAGPDMLAEADSLCVYPLPPARVGGVPDYSQPAFEPTKVFDNLYYVGSSLVGSTIIKTSAGLIVIDTLSLSDHAESQLVAGMRQLGLDPADIKFVIATHAHGDHFGGVVYLRQHFPGFKTVASDTDWPLMSGPPLVFPNGQPESAPRTVRLPGDIGYTGSYNLTLGDTTVRLIETPGHTPGTTSMVYSVKRDGRPVTVMQWGGGGPSDPAVSVDTFKKFVAVAKSEKAAVRWGSHPRRNWAAARAVVGPGQSNLLVEGPDRVGRYLDIVLACKQALAAQTGSAPSEKTNAQPRP